MRTGIGVSRSILLCTCRAFEGIGTIIPIESSMKENRGNYNTILHIVILLVSLILGRWVGMQQRVLVMCACNRFITDHV